MSDLTDEQQETLFGASLSRLFAKLPLWISHPSNIGGFYGILVALALILPYRFGSEEHTGWASDWILHCALLMAACFFLGICSTLINSIFRRMPIAPPRSVLYPMPFLGLGLLSIDRTDILSIHPYISWLLILLPGPLYVHLSWAPRWRLLCMIEDGKNPFHNSQHQEFKTNNSQIISETDTEMESVIDDLVSSEE